MAPTSAVAQQRSSPAERVRAQLQLALGGSFAIWRRGPLGWTCMGGDPSSESWNGQLESSADWDEWLNRLAWDRPTGPQVWAGHDAEMRVGVCIAERGEPIEIVAGRVEVDRERAVAQAAALAMQQVDVTSRPELVDEYASRLSSVFEELTFLRRLSQHIEYCVANRSLGDVALAILPQLREIIDVDGLCLIGVQNPSANGMQIKQVLGIAGQLPAPSEAWPRFIEGLGKSSQRVVVKNYGGTLTPVGPSPVRGLRSFVLTPVAKDGVTFGWLLGVNKRATAAEEQSPLNSLGHDEIGSMEASLLEAAALMLGSHAANHRLFEEKESLVVDVIHTLVSVIEAKDAYTCGHSDRVALVARRLGAELGLSVTECQDIYLSGLLHDIGKIGVADDVLLKPGKLTAEEFEQIKKHPVEGARLLQGLRPLENLIPGVLHHHEAIDGTGYPYGLAGHLIPRMARILAVADAFDAMTSDRPYRPGMPRDKAEEILQSGAGKQWDAEIVKAFMAARDDIVDIGAHWKNHLQQYLGTRESQADQRCAVGAYELAASLEKTREWRELSVNAGRPGVRP